MVQDFSIKSDHSMHIISALWTFRICVKFDHLVHINNSIAPYLIINSLHRSLHLNNSIIHCALSGSSAYTENVNRSQRTSLLARRHTHCTAQDRYKDCFIADLLCPNIHKLGLPTAPPLSARMPTIAWTIAWNRMTLAGNQSLSTNWHE